jgi:hypothetical protein
MMSEIQAGDGWRLLGPDEVLRHGDEMLFYVDHKAYWMPAPDACFNQPIAKHFTYRRRIPAKPEAMEIETKTGLVTLQVWQPYACISQMLGKYPEDVRLDTTEQIRQVIAWLQQVAEWREAQESVAKTTSN